MDPRELEADCDKCSFKGRIVVLSESNGGAKYVLVGESPGANEEVEGKPFIGQAGKLLFGLLNRYGAKREQCFITNSVLCRPHKGVTPKEWSQALACCRPRLHRELNALPHRWVLAIGAKAMQAVADKAQITKWRGAPIGGARFTPKHGNVDFSEFGVFPVYHPAYILRKREELPILARDIEAGLKYLRGELVVGEEPNMVIDDIDDVVDFLETAPARVAVDVETEPAEYPLRAKRKGPDAVHDRLIMVAIATADTVVCISNPAEAPVRVKQLLREFLGNANIKKVMHNGKFDWSILREHNFPVAGFDFDTLIAHATLYPFLDHGLEKVASQYFTVPKWKTLHKEGVSDLAYYCCLDTWMTYRLYGAMQKGMQQARNQEVHDRRLRLSLVGMEMTKTGVGVDRDMWSEYDRITKQRVGDSADTLIGLSRKKNFNPNASVHIHELYSALGAVPVKFTDKGAPSYDTDALELFSKSEVSRVREVTDAIQTYRMWKKQRATYVVGLVHRNWRAHPDFDTARVRTGRWSSQNPNIQNQPHAKKRRLSNGEWEELTLDMHKLFCAAPGRCLVEADFSQIEMRLMGLLSGDKAVCDAYANGEDVYIIAAKEIMGIDKPTKDDRKKAKMTALALNYGASAKKIWESLVGDFPDLTYEEAQRMRRSWYAHHPRIRVYQQKTIETAKRTKYVTEELGGVRQFYPEFDDKFSGEIYNFKMQAGAAHIVNKATMKVFEACGGVDCNLIIQVHDALVLEGADVGTMASLLKENMTTTVDFAGRSMQFPVDIKYGTNWGGMKEWKS